MKAKKNKNSVVGKVIAGIAITLALILALGAIGYFVIYPRVKPDESDKKTELPGKEEGDKKEDESADEKEAKGANGEARALPRLVVDGVLLL